MPCRVEPDRLGLHGRPCKLQVEGQQVGGQVVGQQVGGQVEGQQVGGQEKNGQQYRLSSPIVWIVHKHYSTQPGRSLSRVLVEPNPV